MKKINVFTMVCLLFSLGSQLNAQDHSNFLNGLVSAYSLESATLMTDGLGVNNGTVNGATLVTGNTGNALNFTGSQATMGVVPSSASLDLSGTEITIMVDIYPTANGKSGKSVIVQKGIGSDGDNIYAVSYTSSNTIRFRNHISGTRRDFISTTTAPLNTWSRIICVWKSGELKVIRIDSATDTDTAVYTGTQSVSAGRDLTIGSYDVLGPSVARSFEGRIDNVMIWNRALTAQEQNTLINENLEFSNFNPTNTADNQAPTAPILSSSGNSGTTANLSWTGATDNVGVTAYKVFKDGIQETTLGNISTYTVNGLTEATTYNFTVTAIDAEGNESPSSNAIAVTTSSGSGGGGTTGNGIWTTNSGAAIYSGKVGIGVTSVQTNYQLAVNGKIRTKEIRVEQTNWPDYVFAQDYDLATLEEIQEHIQEKGHLPNIPSAQEVEAQGIELGQMNKMLLEKIEELTLYTLQQQTEIDALKKEIKKQKIDD